jgi:hypothetical protein
MALIFKRKPKRALPKKMKTYRHGSPKFYGHPDFYKLIDELKEIHSRKNHDYAGKDPLSNLKVSESFGIPAWKGCLIRMSDKWSRITQLANKGESLVKDESIIDTLKDLSIYSLLCIILFKEKK